MTIDYKYITISIIAFEYSCYKLGQLWEHNYKENSFIKI